MADFISIIMIIIFAYFAAKKLIIPRIMVKRAAKTASFDTAPIVTEGAGEKDAAAKIVTVPDHRPVTFIDIREERFRVSEDEDPMTGDTLAQRVEKTANEMLLNASLRGRNVQFGSIHACGSVILYTTYTV